MGNKEAIKILEQQLNDAPHSPQLWEDLADLYIQQEQTYKAIEAYEFALAIDPERETTLCKRSIAYLATTNEKLRQKGRSYLKDYCQKHPEEMELKSILEQVDALDAAETLQPRLPYDEAMPEIPIDDEAVDWETIRDPQTDFETYMDILDMLFDGRHYSKAFEVVLTLLPLHPDDGMLHLNCGILYMWKEEPEQAASCFDKALLHASTTANLDFFLGEIGFQYWDKQMFGGALDYYNRISCDKEMHEHLPYMAVCCLELGYPVPYKSLVEQLHPETDENDYKEICRAFYDYIPKNLRDNEIKPFLLKLFERYNPKLD